MTNPRVLLFRRLAVLALCSGIFLWFLSFMLDPYEPKGYVMGDMFLVAVFAVLILVLTNTIVKRRLLGWGAGVVLVLVLSCVAALNPWSVLRPAPAPTHNDASALLVMNEMREKARACMQEGHDLQGRTKKVRYFFSNAIGHLTPIPNASMCRGEQWSELPDGWKYETIEDAETQDGTFVIGAMSRDGKDIVCTETECTPSGAQ